MEILKKLVVLALATIAAVALMFWSLAAFGFHSPTFALLLNWLAMSWVAIYDQIDNGGMPSARRIIPELQHVAAGDVMPWLPSARDGFVVQDVVPERALVLVEPLQSVTADSSAASDASFSALRASWALVLEPLDHGRTRLITRGRLAREWLAAQAADSAASRKPLFIERVYSLLAGMPVLLAAGFGHYLMESRMLRGIKRRAERRSRSAPRPSCGVPSRRSGSPAWSRTIIKSRCVRYC